MYTKVRLACTGACLLERMRDGDPSTRAAPQRRFLRLPAPRFPPATPAPPPEVLP
jgi:hypothetical protein